MANTKKKPKPTEPVEEVIDNVPENVTDENSPNEVVKEQPTEETTQKKKQKAKRCEGFTQGDVVRIKFSAVKYCDNSVILKSEKFKRYTIKDFLVRQNKPSQALLDNDHYIRVKDIAKIER